MLAICSLAPARTARIPLIDEAPLLEYALNFKPNFAPTTSAELDASSDHMKTKIANAEQMKVHTMLVIGNRDMEANAVSLRLHGQGNLGAKPRGDAIADILQSIKERRA